MRKIRLTETQLHRIVLNTAKRLVNEGWDPDFGYGEYDDAISEDEENRNEIYKEANSTAIEITLEKIQIPSWCNFDVLYDAISDNCQYDEVDIKKVLYDLGDFISDTSCDITYEQVGYDDDDAIEECYKRLYNSFYKEMSLLLEEFEKKYVSVFNSCLTGLMDDYESHK